jgi:hypothetical protein
MHEFFDLLKIWEYLSQLVCNLLPVCILVNKFMI